MIESTAGYLAGDGYTHEAELLTMAHATLKAKLVPTRPIPPLIDGESVQLGTFYARGCRCAGMAMCEICGVR